MPIQTPDISRAMRALFLKALAQIAVARRGEVSEFLFILSVVITGLDPVIHPPTEPRASECMERSRNGCHGRAMA